jgi:DNA-binding MarR family transcriptional regulator
MDVTNLAEEILWKTGIMVHLNWTKKASSFAQGEMFILNYLYDRKDTVLPSELSCAMNASSARIAMALKNLESKGYIERRVDLEDRRRVLVTITALGAAAVSTERDSVREKMQRIIEELGTDDAREYIRIITRMIDIAERMD